MKERRKLKASIPFVLVLLLSVTALGLLFTEYKSWAGLVAGLVAVSIIVIGFRRFVYSK